MLTTLFAHELGHVLNLAQAPNDNSIMEGTHGGGDCPTALANYFPTQHHVQATDAAKAGDCANRGSTVPGGGGNGEGFGQSEQNGECWDAYWVIVWYGLDGDYWTVTDMWFEYLYTTCDGDPYPAG